MTSYLLSIISTNQMKITNCDWVNLINILRAACADSESAKTQLSLQSFLHFWGLLV